MTTPGGQGSQQDAPPWAAEGLPVAPQGFSTPSPRPAGPVLRWVGPVLAAALVLAVALAVAFDLVRRDRARQAGALAFAVDRLADGLGAQIRAYVDILPGLRLATATGNGTDADFRQYLDGVSLATRFPDLAVVFSASWLTGAERAAFERAAREDRSVKPQGRPSFAIQPAGERERYLVLRHLEPEGPSLGYDLLDPARSYAADALRAIDSGEPTATDPLLLAAERDQQWDPERVAVVIRQGAYRGGRIPDSVAARRAAAVGVVGVSFRAARLVRVALPAGLQQQGTLQVTDLVAQARSPGRALLFGPATLPETEAGQVLERRIVVGERTWLLRFAPRPLVGWPLVAWAVLAAGALVALLLAGWLRTLAGRHEWAAQQVDERTRELQIEKRELMHLERRYRLLLESVADGVLRKRPDGTILGANLAACRIFGMNEGQLQAIGRHGLVDAADTRFAALLAARERKGAARGRLRMRRADGHLFEAEVSYTTYVDHEGRAAVTMIVRDIEEQMRQEREREQLQAQLWQSQKLTSLGTLAGGVAHDFNNALGAILANTALLREEARDAPAQQRLDLIRQSAQHGRALVRQLLAFGRPQTGERRVIEIGPLLRETVEMLRSTIPAGISLQLELPPAPLHANVDPTQIRQVVLNLCTNSAQAMTERVGRIVVGASAWEGDAAQPGGWVRLRVADDGCGMDEDTRSRMFEPFFTTRGLGGGTGLGTAVVHGIVEAHAGRLTVESAPEQGTTVDVWLPAAPAAASDSAGAPDASGLLLPAFGGGRLVAYVDDDSVMSIAAAAMLARLGFEPVCFDGPDALLAAASAEAAPWWAVVSDRHMPGLGGEDLLLRVRAAGLAARTVLVSGFIDDTVEARARQAGIDAVLPKEWLVEQLGPCLSALLESESAAASFAADARPVAVMPGESRP